MSVTVDVTLRWRPWGYNQVDKGLPEGVWYAQGSVLGDVTGGFAEVNIILNPASIQRSGRSFSIELSLPTSAAGAQQVFRANSLNMDVLGPGLSNPIQKAFTQLMFTSAVGVPIAAGQVQSIRPMFFLGAQGGTDNAAELQGQWPNADGDTFGWYATGYSWEAGAQNAPGGLRRPVGGVF